MTNPKRGPGRPSKLAASPADAPGAAAPAREADPVTQDVPAPAPADVAHIQAVMAEEREKIMALARKEVEAAQAKAREDAKYEAEELVKAAARAEAAQRAYEADQLRLARQARDLVEVRVLPKGDGEVFTGDVDEITSAAVTYRRGEKFWIEKSIAQAQEDAGRVEIL